QNFVSNDTPFGQMTKECLHRTKPASNGNGLQSTVLFVFYESLKMFPAYAFQVSHPLDFQKLQEDTYGGVVQLKGVGTSVPAIQVREVLLGEFNARQLLSFKLKRELFEYLLGRISGLPKWENHPPRGGLKLTRFYLF